MTSKNNNPALLNQQVEFIQHDIPGLEDGEYRLHVSQNLFDENDKKINDTPVENSYVFAVLGDRFSLKKPDETVMSVFPADNASGEYSTVLPSVVFTKTTLPWSRYPTLKIPYEPPAPGQDTNPDADVPTWLTIILLDEDDVSHCESQNLKLELNPKDSTIGDLFPSSVYSGSTLKDNYSYFYRATTTDELEPGENLGDSIQTLDIPLKLFYDIAPTIADLNLMAHVRKVSLIDKPTIPGVSDIGEPLGSFSIVFGNRLPATQRKTSAYLVSLEELEQFLPTDENGGAPSTSTFDENKSIRLAVLKHWTFFSTGQSATFVDRLMSLNGVGDTGREAEYTNLCIPFKNIANEQIKNALSMGYAPLNERFRTGEKSVSWYRGPLTPYPVRERRVEMPVSSPDKASIFDPTTGMFDISYSTAWTLGRLMSLQDTSFSTTLYNWKKGLSREVLEMIENEILFEDFTDAARLRAGLVAGQKKSFSDLLRTTVNLLNPEAKKSHDETE